MSLVTCLSNDYYLATQADIDAFPSFGCNYITGTLEVSGSDITDLSPLDVIKQVDEYVSVDHTGIVTAANVFDSLEEVGWGIYWYNNDEATHIDGFHNLIRTGDNIDFWYHDKAESITGFEKLVTAGWSLEFGGNAVLTQIPDFCSLETITSSLFIMDNDILASITSFPALTYIDWSFDVLWNPFVTSPVDLCGFASFYSANSGVYPGGGSNNIQLGDGTPVTPAEIMANPCGFTPISCVPPATPSPTAAPTDPPSSPPTTFCSTLTAAKDCKGACKWNGKNKVCQVDV